MKTILLFLLLSLSLRAMDITSISSTFDGSPDANVAGCVNAKTGDLFAASSDIHVSGYEPITISRVYLSSGHIDAHNIWTVLPQRLLYEEDTTLYVTEDGGGIVPLMPSGPQTYVIDHSKIPAGVTNTSQENIGPSTNIKLYTAFRHREDYIEVITPNGAHRYYRVKQRFSTEERTPKKSTKSVQGVFLLTLEILPNGNNVLYEYENGTFEGTNSAINKFGFPKTIRTTNPSQTITYAQIDFTWDGPNLHFTTSDESAGTYEAFSRGNDRKYSLKTECFFNFTGTRGQLETINYTPNTPQKLFLLQNRRFFQKRGIDASYYTPEQRHPGICGGSILTQKNDPRNFRVSLLSLPTGENGEMLPAYFFNYHIPSKNTHYPQRTDVTSRDKSYTSFFFSPHFDFLISKQTYTSDNKLLQKIDYTWDIESKARGNLISESRFGKNGKILELAWNYGRKKESPYLLSTTIKGNLTGQCSTSYTTHFEHYRDPFHLLKTKKEDNGLREEYTYRKNTNLPERKKLYNQNTLIKEEIWIYDNNNWLETHAILDPFTKNTLSTHYKRITEGDGIGFPSEEELHYNGHLVSKTTFRYDKKCRIIEKTFYGNAQEPLYTLTYEYDRFDNCIQETDPLGRTTQRRFNKFNQLIFEQKGNEPFATYFTYNQMGKLTKQERKTYDGQTKALYKTYDTQSFLVAETDELGNVTHTTNDSLGRPLTKTLPGEKTYSYDYDYFSSPTTIIDPLGKVAKNTYSSLGAIAESRGSDGQTQTFSYHPDGRIDQKIEKNAKTRYHYDLYHNLASVTHHTLDGTLTLTEYEKKHSLFHLLEETSSTGATTTYTYNDCGQTKTKTSGAFSIHYAYDALGNVIEETHTLKGKTILRIITEYDLIGRITSQSKWGETGELLTEKKLTYDIYDNVILSNKCGAIETASYDSWNRPIEKKDAEGAITRYTYSDGIEYTELLCYEKTTVSPKGTQTFEITSPTQKRLLLVIKDAYGTTLKTEKYTYNKNDELIEEKHIAETTLTLKRSYDTFGNLSSLTESYENGSRTTTYSYNQYNRLLSCKKPSGLTLYYTYDSEDRITSITSSDGTVDEKRNYDTFGNLITLTSGETTITRNYDIYGNLIQENLPAGTILSSYNDVGQRTLLQTPHRKIHYTYTADKLQTISFDNYTHHILSYDLHENITKEQDIFGNIITHTYDLLSRKTATTSPHIQENAAYDSEHNLIAYSFNGENHILDYNPLSQLTQDNEDTYTADAHYRPLSQKGSTFSYDDFGQLSYYSGTTYTYDIDGRRTTGRYTYTYDALDRLLTVSSSETTIEFTYDTLNRILTKKVNGQIQHFLYDGMTDIGSDSDSRILGPHGSIALFSPSLSVPFTDAIGNVRALISNAPEYYPYSLYGEGYPENASPYRYHGKRATLSLYNFGARAYDSLTTQWLSEDPAGFHDAPFLHQFLKNNPFLYSDEFGFSVSSFDQSIMNYWETNVIAKHRQNWENTISTGKGILHGIADAGYHTFESAALLGTAAHLDGLDYTDRTNMLSSFASNSASIHTSMDNAIMKALHVDPNDQTYQNSRFLSCATIEYAPIVIGGFQLARSGISRLASRSAKNAALAAPAFNPPATSSTSSLLLRNKLIAEQIASGHAFEKHVVIQKEFPGFSRDRFQNLIQDILSNPSTENKLLRRGRSAYWSEETGTIIIRDPSHKDGGTAFKPSAKRSYYEDEVW